MIARYIVSLAINENPCYLLKHSPFASEFPWFTNLSQLHVEAWVREGLVEWPGHVEVNIWLAQASVYVSSSYREGLPRSTQEAMAMGLPVITTDVPGGRVTVEQGVNGFMVLVRDTSALAQALLIFVKQPELIASMGAASRRMAEAKFNVHKINAEILKIMEI